jgi:hypothetical protein
MIPIALRLFLGGALKRLWGIVSHASFAQLIAVALAIFALVQHFELAGAHRAIAKRDGQIVKLTGELQRISTAKNDQATVTGERIVTVTRIVHDAEGRAKVVESAPLSGGCKTPVQVLGADL